MLFWHGVIFVCRRMWFPSRSASRDTIVTVTSVQVVPVTSAIVNTRFVPQFVTVTETDARTVTRTQATTQIVPVRSTYVQNVFRTNYQTDFIT